VRLDLAACLADDRDAILRAVRVELGDVLAADDAGAVAVGVDCAATGIEAGVVIEVRPPDSSRRYRYALDWRTQPLDARPRLVGLAVAEAVDASRIELTAVPEPQPAPLPPAGAAPGRARAASDWTVALVGDRRVFSGQGGVDLLGAGLAPALRLSSHLRLAIDVLAEGATVLTASGAVSVLSISSAPRVALHAGGRLHGELGVGARIGVVRMHGEALPGSRLVGQSVVRPWLGPMATAALGAELTPALSLSASLELGVVASGATARDLGDPVATVGGAWTSLGLTAALAL